MRGEGLGWEEREKAQKGRKGGVGVFVICQNKSGDKVTQKPPSGAKA